MRRSYAQPSYEEEDVQEPTIVRSGLPTRFQGRMADTERDDMFRRPVKRIRTDEDPMGDFRLIQYARALARENDPDNVSQKYIGWLSSMRDAIMPFDAMLPNDFTASVTNTLGWSGRGWGTITMDLSEGRYNVLRMTFAPWCIEPVLWKRGYHAAQSSVPFYGGNLPQQIPTVPFAGLLTDDVGMATITAWNGLLRTGGPGITEFKTAPRDLQSYNNLVGLSGRHLSHTGSGPRVYDRLLGDPAGAAAGLAATQAGTLQVPVTPPQNLLYGDIADLDVEHGRYQGDTPLTALGLATSAYPRNGVTVPTKQYSGSIYDPLYTPFPVGQFLGGACEISVVVSEGSSCSIACVGQNETRDVGCTVLSAEAQWRQNIGYPSSPDYVNDERVYLFGELENVVPGMILVGNSFNAKQTWYIPIMPNRVAFVSVNLPKQHANYLMTPGFISNAYSLSSGVGASALDPTNQSYTFTIDSAYTGVDAGLTGVCNATNSNATARVMPQFGTGHAYSFNTWYLTNTSLFQQASQATLYGAGDPNVTTAITTAAVNRGDPQKMPFSPFLRINADVVGPALQYANGPTGSTAPTLSNGLPASVTSGYTIEFPTPFQNFNVDSVNVPAKIKLDACTSNIAECIKQGMPQFEVKVASGAVSITFEFKMFYRFIVSNTHPLYLQSAVAKTYVTNGAELFTTVGVVGSGMDGAEASRDYMRRAGIAAAGSQITNVQAGHFAFATSSHSGKMSQPAAGIQPNQKSVVSDYDSAFSPSATKEYTDASEAAKRGLPELAALIGKRTAQEVIKELETNPRVWQSFARGGNDYTTAMPEKTAFARQEADYGWDQV